MAGAAIYLVLPSLIAVLGAWPRLSTLDPAWFTVALAAELASFTCNFALQRLALRTKDWFPVVTAGLTPTTQSAASPRSRCSRSAACSRRPCWRMPAILAGVPVSRGLVHTALLGIAAFVLYAVFGVIVLRTDWPLATLGRVAQRLWNRVTRGHRRPVTGLDQRLLAERDTIGAVLGENWRQAVVLTAGRFGFDYGCLLAALRATGAEPQPSLVLLAYAAAGIIALFPVTPGGLGIVEASLSGLLILAGVAPATPSWPPWPTGSPPTGSPWWPGRRPTCCSATVTGSRSPGAPHRGRPTPPDSPGQCRASLRSAVTAVTGRWPVAETAPDAPTPPSDA